MSAVIFKIYDLSYDTKKVKKRKNMIYSELLAAIKESKTSQDNDHQKYQDFEAHCQIS